MNILEEMMKKVPDMKVIVNGDDARVCISCHGLRKSFCVTYGMSKPVIENKTNEIRDGPVL